MGHPLATRLTWLESTHLPMVRGNPQHGYSCPCNSACTPTGSSKAHTQLRKQTSSSFASVAAAEKLLQMQSCLKPRPRTLHAGRTLLGVPASDYAEGPVHGLQALGTS
jgi:hypothetical protein